MTYEDVYCVLLLYRCSNRILTFSAYEQQVYIRRRVELVCLKFFPNMTRPGILKPPAWFGHTNIPIRPWRVRVVDASHHADTSTHAQSAVAGGRVQKEREVRWSAVRR